MKRKEMIVVECEWYIIGPIFFIGKILLNLD